MNVRSVRLKLKMNQAEFWSRVGVTQSGGCRYEAGRRIPEPVLMLLAIAYANRRECERALKRLIPTFKGMRA